MNDNITLNIGNRTVPNPSCCTDPTALCARCGQQALERMALNLPTYDENPLRPAGGGIGSPANDWQKIFEEEAGFRSQKSEEIVLNIPANGGPAGGKLQPVVWEF